MAESENLKIRMEWIQTAPGAPYFQTESGADWTPVGHNDAITWVTLRGAFRKNDLPAVDRYLAMLSAARGDCSSVDARVQPPRVPLP